MGPVAKKILFLREHLRSRNYQLSRLELEQMAGILDALIEPVATMEERPVPPRFRVVEGGPDPKPPSAA